MRAMVRQNIKFVARTLHNAGVPGPDLDDEVQRTFIAVARRLDDVHHGAERGFLFRVALHTAAHARRSLARRREIPTDMMADRIEARATPEDLADRKQMWELLHEFVDGMDEPLRSVFRLFEIEEKSMVEIAAMLGVPPGTVASRLRRARARIRAHVRVELR